jgi:hypothetical protein
MHRENQETRTGPLRNGNPRGNPNLAPRCGAKTRTGCPCRSPAMTNGRCRMHGGASTGPRTPEGRARISAANTTHGFYTPESQAARRRTDTFIAETRALLASLQQTATPAQTPASRRSSLPQAAPTQQDAPCTPPPHTP